MSSLCRLTTTAVSLLCALAVLSGCGDDESKSETGPKAQIVEFSADRTEIVEGESTTLRWSTREAASVILLENGIKRETGALPATGSVEITPARDTTYRLEATDAQGLVVARETAVTVAPLGPPTIEAFEASPTETRSGQVVNLMWQVRGGTQIEIVDQTGQVLFRGESKGAEGRLEVRPTTTTTYELRVHNAYGSATAEVEVVVALPPTVTLEADATQVAYGDEVTLSWVVRDATQVYVADPEGRILFEGPAEDGSLTVVAEVSGAYRATAMGTGGEASATVNVHIQPEILEFGAAVHGSARPGNIALVEWHVVGADRIAIFNGPSEVYETSRTQGQISAPIGTSGDFVLRAYSGSLMTEEHAQIQVRDVPLIRRVTTGPMVTAGQGVAGVSTIGWEIDGASKLTIEVDPGGIVDVTDKSPRMDEVEIVFLGPGTVTVTAYNSSGHAEYVVESPVDPVPTFETFFAAPSRVHSGGTVQLHWETRDAVWVALEQDGVELAIDPSLVDGMVEVDSIVAPSTFVLRARNSLGHVVASEPVTVEVGAPNSLSFDTADGLRLYRVGTFVDLVWENDGGTELVVNDLSKATDNELCRITDPVLIRRGGCSIEMPSEQKPLPLELVVTNDSGSDRRTLDLQAVAGPIILEFYPDVPAITDGGSVLFSWVVMRDADGNVPILTLVDDRGVEYPMDGVDPIQGSKRFDVVGWDENPRVFTLTATSAVPPAYSLSTEVMVYGVPTVDSLSASPTFVEIEGQPVTIHWETTHGASLMIFPVDRDGNASDVPLFWTEDPDETAAGSTTFQPTKTVPNVRLVVTNPTGTSTEADLRIGVSPATIASFTANGVEAPQEVELVDGEDLTLAWEILRSDDALLLEEFVDISNRPNAIELGVAGTNASHKVVLDFPEGFVFPYDGGEYTTVAITNSGYLTFDPGSVVATGDLVIPVQNNANGSKLDIAPFWDSMVASDGSDGQLGTLWWEFVEGEVDRIVIQWTNYRFTTSTYNPADLTFQVVLYEDGRFEYRYGKMDGPHEATRARWATIGAQSRDCPSNTCPFGVQLVRQSEQVHGLEGRVYRFDGLHDYRADASTFPVPMDGSMTFKPAETRTYTLRSWNGHSEDEREIRVVVHPRARLQAWTEPLEPAPGEPVDLHWSGVALTSLVIEDEQGTVIHTASPTELESGSIALGAVPQGTYRYTLRGVGQLPRDQVVEEIDLRVYPPFSLDDFTVTPESIKYGETVTLSWAATNATSVQIEAFPGGMLSLPPTPDGGSVQHQPEETTTYVITLESHGRHRIEERTVEVRIAWIDDFQLSRTEVPFGGTVDLSWEIGDPTGEGQLTIEPFWRAYELREVTTDAPFQTIVGDGGVELPIGSSTATTGYSNVTFPAGFSFPFIGETKTSARAFNYGYLHFGTNQTSGSSTDFVMPRQNGTTYDAGVMGVFWGSLSKQSTGKIFGKFVQDASDPDKDHYIIEWANFQFSSTTYNPADLNFQIVLYRDGSFEYRYGNMTAANTAQANGSAIGIGYNVGNWGPKPYQLGYQLLYNLEMPGGMSNRSWRYEPLPKGPQATWSYQPNDSGPIRLCIETPKWKECEEQFLTVYKPGDVVISELMVDPGSGGTQWFEIRNLGAGPIDLEGKTLRIGSDTHTIQTGAAFLIPPGGHAVFAPAYDPDVDPDYVYGTSLVLGTPAGSVALEWDGMVLGETSWNSSWTFTPGVAKELLATKQRPGEESRSTAADYCDSAEPFGAGGRFGTPGTHGGGCATVHGYEVDFAANHPFIDIRDTGTPIYHFTSTAQTYEIPGGLGFTIPYFNGTASELWLNSYGLFGLSGSPSNSSANRNLGTGSGIVLNQGILSPFWDTMIIYGPESMVYWDRRSVGNNQVMIVQFHQYKYNSTSYPGYYEFQLQIWDNGDIAFVYGDIWRTHNITNTLRYYEGYSATIGLESFTSTEAILYLYAEARLRPFQSFYFKKL